MWEGRTEFTHGWVSGEKPSLDNARRNFMIFYPSGGDVVGRRSEPLYVAATNLGFSVLQVLRPLGPFHVPGGAWRNNLPGRCKSDYLRHGLVPREACHG